MNHTPDPELMRLDEALEEIVSSLSVGQPVLEPIEQVKENIRQTMEDIGRRERLIRLWSIKSDSSPEEAILLAKKLRVLLPAVAEAMRDADAALALLFYPVRERLIATLRSLEVRPEVATELSWIFSVAFPSPKT